MTSRASCIRSRASGVEGRASRRARATASTSAIGQVGAGQDDRRARRRGSTVRVEVRDLRLTHRAEDSRLCCRPPTRSTTEVRVLAFIDQIVIPFLNSLYGAVGYLGVMLAMAIESAMIPLPSELILPYAGFLVSDPSQIEPLTGAALELLDRRRSWRRSGTRSGRSSPTRSGRRAAGRSSSATASTC